MFLKVFEKVFIYKCDQHIYMHKNTYIYIYFYVYLPVHMNEWKNK